MPAAAILVALWWSQQLTGDAGSRSFQWSTLVAVSLLLLLAGVLGYGPQLLGADPALPDFPQVLQQSGILSRGGSDLIWHGFAGWGFPEISASLLAVVGDGAGFSYLFGRNGTAPPLPSRLPTATAPAATRPSHYPGSTSGGTLGDGGIQETQSGFLYPAARQIHQQQQGSDPLPGPNRGSIDSYNGLDPVATSTVCSYGAANRTLPNPGARWGLPTDSGVSQSLAWECQPWISGVPLPLTIMPVGFYYHHWITK